MKELIERDVTHSNMDFIITPEAMGIPIATIVSILMDRPYLVVRKRMYDLPGELEVQQITGYSKSLMYINSINSILHGVIIIDDVVSTGGTLTAIIDVLENNNIKVFGAYTIIEKNNITKSLRDQGYNVKSLVNVVMGKDCIESVGGSK